MSLLNRRFRYPTVAIEGRYRSVCTGDKGTDRTPMMVYPLALHFMVATLLPTFPRDYVPRATFTSTVRPCSTSESGEWRRIQ